MAKTTTNQTNPFDLPTVSNEPGTSKIQWTPQLISTSNSRALELIKKVGSTPELHELANEVLEHGDAEDTIKLIETVFDEETIKSDAEFMSDADEKELGRLLESRRSDRSKSKAKGPKKSVQNAQSFISAMYAELLVREVMGKPYQSTPDLDIEDLASDQEALNRKIRSLQSKKTRVGKLAEYDEDYAQQLEEVEAEIERLKSLRVGAPRVSSKTIIKSTDLETIREALGKVSTEDLDDDMMKKVEELMKKLG